MYSQLLSPKQRQGQGSLFKKNHWEGGRRDQEFTHVCMYIYILNTNLFKEKSTPFLLWLKIRKKKSKPFMCNLQLQCTIADIEYI